MCNTGVPTHFYWLQDTFLINYFKYLIKKKNGDKGWKESVEKSI